MPRASYDAAMKFGIIGSGRMGTALGSALERVGHQVMFGSRDESRRHESQRLAGTYREASRYGEAVILATPWPYTISALEQADGLAGKVLLSCVNPETDDSPLAIGHTTSAAEEIARRVPKAHIVEAFNGIYAAAIDLTPAPSKATVAYCTDDPSARELAAMLIRSFGFDALDCGPLRNARYLEPLASLTVYLVRQAGYGPLGIHCEWKRTVHAVHESPASPVVG